MEIHSLDKCFGGTLGYCSHQSHTTHCTMRFSMFMPPQVEEKRVPLLYYLSGLSCTEENFTVKAGAYRIAAELGIAIVAPDTSPRGEDVPNDEQEKRLGHSAGFYMDATEEPWSTHYNMYSYVVEELPALINNHFMVNPERQSIFGHSMGGHGALTIYLRNPKNYQSVSAFAPIVAPTQSHWVDTVLPSYLGSDRKTWVPYDATALMLARNGRTDNKNQPKILIDQGTSDELLERLKPDLFKSAAELVGYPVELRMQEGYGHNYFFVQTFMEDHLRHHARYLLT